MSRTYLDWNASAPLRPEARGAILGAIGTVGNPSSVHFEGRKARAIVERARAQVAAAFGAHPAEVIFTSGATEAAALAMAGRNLGAARVEHECVLAWSEPVLETTPDGRIVVPDPGNASAQAANSETGILQQLPAGLAVTDYAQAFGKTACNFRSSGAEMAIISAHKIGGPTGVGALVVCEGRDVPPQILGGGQESGFRAGTENLPGIAGFGAAAEAASRDLEDGVWSRVASLRDSFEMYIEERVPDTVFIGRGAPRLPNTSCFALPGWESETQVIQMDLQGFSVSAGSACSSGKVSRAGSPALQAMGYDTQTVRSAIRVSIGPSTRETDLMNFAEAWSASSRRAVNKARAA